MISSSFLFMAVTAIFTIISPLGAIPPFLAMTADDTPLKRRAMAKKACWIAFGILVTFAAAGSFIFRFFGITLPAVKIAGGILLFQIAIDMLNARTSRTRSTEKEVDEGVVKDDIAVFPLAIPLLSGPGAIVTVFILADRAKTPLEIASLYGAIAITLAITYLILRQAGFLVDLLGKIGMNLFMRLTGLILAAIAVQFALDGFRQAWPGLAGLS